MGRIPWFARLGVNPKRYGITRPIFVDSLGHWPAKADTPMHGKIQPLGRLRPFIPQREGKALYPGQSIGDIAWRPEYDADVKAV